MIKYFFILVLGFSACKKTEVPLEIDKKTIQYKNLDKVDKNLLSLDVYYKNMNTIRPVVIYIHGGGWSIGDKSQKLENKLNLFNELDYVFVSVNYRLSPFPFDTSNADRVQYPIHNIDIAEAIKWVYDNIADYGGNKEKIAIIGHSAGAHLVALTGTNSQFLQDEGLSLNCIKGVAVIDTQGYDVHEQVINGSNQNMYINAFGTDELLNREASPIFNVLSNKTYPKFFIAKRGTVERIAYADAFIEVLQNNGVFVVQVDGSVYNHAEINNAIGDEGETLITEPLKQFFTACFQ
jgi:acetyl esterase/lipase